MNLVFNITMDMIHNIKQASDIKVSRSFTDFFADRIKQATTESTLMGFAERLCNLVNVELGFINKTLAGEFVKSSQSSIADDVLNWLRKNNRIASMIVFIKDDEERNEVINSIEIDNIEKIDPGQALLRRQFDIEMKVSCTTPLAHGGDVKAGNATLFRRMDVLSDTNNILTLPYYAGNAVRGQTRDILADHFLRSIGLKPNRTTPPINLWFFHSLYAGGALAEKNKETAGILKVSGERSLKAEGIKRIRETIPHLSALGFAFGNRILSGRCNFGDLRPICKQWGHDTNLQSGELIEWLFLTRREDHEGHPDKENSSMIANCECLKAGTVLQGGVDIHDIASELERSALARGLYLLQEKGRLGAENRRDCGGVKIEFESDMSDPVLYDDYLHDNQAEILEFLKEINAYE